jgi:signal transduction histidine kinase
VVRFTQVRTALCLAGIATAVAVILWTESYSWRRVDAMRDRRRPISQEEVSALHGVLTWSSVVLLAMGACLVVLVYKGIVAPLRRRLEQSRSIIERQEKLSSLGVLAAGVAHEIRNPLTSIKVRLFTQQASLAKGTEALEDNLFITDEISRLETIVKEVLAFARPADPQFKSFRATQPMRELAALFRSTLDPQQIRLQEEFLADPQLTADPQQIKQVLINLVQNAADAIRERGTITLRTATRPPPHGSRGEAEAVLEVEDTGPGIPPDVQARLFDPFFTTKASGTGLGLSIAARILHNHRGHLEYQTQPGQGTVFRLVLPLAPAARSLSES